MPVIFETQGIKFRIYPQDHQPPHIHVIKNECEVKIKIDDLSVIKNFGFSNQEIKEIVQFLKPRIKKAMEVWYDYQK